MAMAQQLQEATETSYCCHAETGSRQELFPSHRGV